MHDVGDEQKEASAMEQSEPSERKRRNREHTNSRNGCAQCKARKVKVRVIELTYTAAGLPCSYSTVRRGEAKLWCLQSQK